eukprot:CAMPEP_0206478428 /NCGR_PEP_ID=MMETSP0324_2-20121206/36019_1 /ASSEMBLY_ACC=CAM_ASM_000836 /TAXON_ID=2866 /ORGANISM="Crypthecodinium cohnii, Strain Seligo" /LENGTH=48 /DNA_ID= /DNA_START= /DNA_END= /DNA_ORIENTATION=
MEGTSSRSTSGQMTRTSLSPATMGGNGSFGELGKKFKNKNKQGKRRSA